MQIENNSQRRIEFAARQLAELLIMQTKHKKSQQIENSNENKSKNEKPTYRNH